LPQLVVSRSDLDTTLYRRQDHYINHWFFFSSRRRHTRSKRDWSSDVCSSDLVQLFGGDDDEAATADEGTSQVEQQDRTGQSTDRSEERRVGKECRPRGPRSESKKK